MKRSFLLFVLCVLLLFSFVFPVCASDVEGSAATVSVAEPDASMSDQTTLEDINNSIGVIQSQIYIILIVGLLYFIYKFLRLFF